MPVQAPTVKDFSRKEDQTQILESMDQYMRAINRLEAQVQSLQEELGQVTRTAIAQTNSVSRRVIVLESQVATLTLTVSTLNTAYLIHRHEITVDTAAGGTAVNIVGGAAGTLRSSTGGIIETGVPT